MAKSADEMTDAVIVYRDAWGHRQELRVTRATALGIRAIRARYRRAAQKWEDRHVSFTVLSAESDADERVVDGRSETARQRTERADGNPWEGPRHGFDWLIAESTIWPVAPREDGKARAPRKSKTPATAPAVAPPTPRRPASTPQATAPTPPLPASAKPTTPAPAPASVMPSRVEAPAGVSAPVAARS